MSHPTEKLGFIILDIKTVQFSIISEHFNSEEETELITDLQFKFNLKDKQIAVFLGFEFVQHSTPFIKIQVKCLFQVEPNSWSSFENDSKMRIPKGFLVHLAMISTGTTRGILFAKTEGTLFSKFIIPTIDLTTMVKVDAEFDLFSA